MSRALRVAYTKNGGGHPELLAQLAAAENKAVALVKRQKSNLFQAGTCLFFSSQLFESYCSICFCLYVHICY